MTILDKQAPNHTNNRRNEAALATHNHSSTSAEKTPNSSGEDPNLHLARCLKDAKSGLINALSHFSLTALWLLNRYEQQLGKEESDSDDESLQSAELTAPLTDLNRLYQNAVQHEAGKSIGTQAVDDLMHALQWFPYTFKDLTDIVSLNLYAYSVIEIDPADNQGIDQQVKEHIKKRLSEVSRRSKDHISFDDVIDQYRQQFYGRNCIHWSQTGSSLFLADLISLERNWLRMRQKLVSANTGLVLYIANQYKGVFLDFEDLVQEGNTGLLKAADRFDYRLGFKFSTYAGYWIKQAISRALSRCERVVRIPCGQMGVINKFFRAKEQLLAQTGKEPSLNELVEFTQLSREEINSILSISQSAITLESTGEDEENSFAPIEFLEQQVFSHPFGEIAQSDLEQLIEQAIKTLSLREAKIICGHFGVYNDQELTLREIGMELNLTRERVRQIEVGALQKMKRNYGRQLMNFL